MGGFCPDNLRKKKIILSQIVWEAFLKSQKRQKIVILAKKSRCAMPFLAKKQPFLTILRYLLKWSKKAIKPLNFTVFRLKTVFFHGKNVNWTKKLPPEGKIKGQSNKKIKFYLIIDWYFKSAIENSIALLKYNSNF